MSENRNPKEQKVTHLNTSGHQVDDKQFKAPKQPLSKNNQFNIARAKIGDFTNSSKAITNIPNATNTSNVSISRPLLKDEIAVDSTNKGSKALTKNDKLQTTAEGYSLTTSPPLTKQIRLAPSITTTGSTVTTHTTTHTTIPHLQAYNTMYSRAFGAQKTDQQPLEQPKVDKKKLSPLKKTTTLLQELENMQGQPSKPADQNEYELGLVPIDIYTTSDYETAEQIVEARGYVLQERLGSGAFANVYKAWHINEQIYTACKVIEMKKKKRKRLNDLKHELYVLEKMDHLNIVKLYEHFLIDEKVYIFLEYAACGTLSDYVRKRGPLKESKCRKWFKQISSGVYHMHAQGISHRDLKLGNILIDEYRNLKISDFGLSRVSYRKGYGVFYCTSYAGTEPYMAVEIMRKNEAGKRIYDPLIADIWAMGVCLYAMSNKAYPFNPEDKELMISNQLNKKWRFTKKLRNKLSPELKDLIKNTLEPDPKKRITFLGIATHPWMQISADSDIRPQSGIIAAHQSVSISTTQTDDSRALRDNLIPNKT